MTKDEVSIERTHNDFIILNQYILLEHSNKQFIEWLDYTSNLILLVEKELKMQARIEYDTDKYILAPIEPTDAMLKAACNDGAIIDGKPVWKRSFEFQAKWKYQAMLEVYKLETQEQEHYKEQAKDA